MGLSDYAQASFSSGNYAQGVCYLISGTAVGVLNLATLGGTSAAAQLTTRVTASLGRPALFSTTRQILASEVGAVRFGKSAVSAGEAGSFGELSSRAVVGDQLTAHHMPQAAAGFTAYEEGGALVLSRIEHALTRTYAGRGIIALRNDSGLSFRSVLYKDIQDIRANFGTNYNSGLLELIQYYRSNFPALVTKMK